MRVELGGGREEELEGNATPAGPRRKTEHFGAEGGQAGSDF